MSQELFADRIGEITITGAVVRVDLMTYSVTERDANNQPKLEFRQRIVMPVDGFLQSFGLMSQVMQQLEKRGAIRRTPTVEKPGEPAPKPAGGSGSPNFKPD